MKNIQAVVFDLYGTLIYIADETKPLTRLCIDLGLQTSDEFREARRIALGEDFDNPRALVDRIKPNPHIDLNAYEEELEKELKSASLYPETIKTLEELRKQGIILGLISNLTSPYKRPFFDLGLSEYFDEVLFSCEEGLRKPDPRVYQKIVERFKINPAQVLMTGDNVNTDVLGPKQIGMNAVHLDRSSNASNSISTLEEVFQYL